MRDGQSWRLNVREFDGSDANFIKRCALFIVYLNNLAIAAGSYLHCALTLVPIHSPGWRKSCGLAWSYSPSLSISRLR